MLEFVELVCLPSAGGMLGAQEVVMWVPEGSTGASLAGRSTILDLRVDCSFIFK